MILLEKDSVKSLLREEENYVHKTFYSAQTSSDSEENNNLVVHTFHILVL